MHVVTQSARFETSSLYSLMMSNTTMALPTNSVYATKNSCHEIQENSLGDIFYSVFMLLILLFSIVGNAIVILAFIMSRSLKHRPTFYFVASLACSDLVMAVFQIPFKVSTRLHGMNFCHGLPACYVQIIADALGNIASILNLLLISIDRFIAIQMPFQYVELLCSSRSKRLLSLPWIVAAFWSFLGIFSWNKNSSRQNKWSIRDSSPCQNDNYYYYVVSFAGIYFPVLVAMTCLYIQILRVAMTQIHKIESHEVVRVQTLTPDFLESNNLKTVVKRRRWNLSKELKATKSVAIVYLAFCVCWLPSFVINTIIFIDRNYFPTMRNENKGLFLFIYMTFVDILPMVHAMVNPIIYSFSNTLFRNAVVNAWRKMMGKPPQRRESNFSVSHRSRATSNRGSHLTVSPMINAAAQSVNSLVSMRDDKFELNMKKSGLQI